MKKNYLLLFSLILIFQCASPTQQQSETTSDTVAAPSAPTEAVSSSSETADESEYISSIDLDEFAKHPFENDYPYIKSVLRNDSIEFTLVTRDTVHSEDRTIEFDSSRIEFLDSDPQFQDELGDLICSSDIRSPKFQFNQNIVIGMPQDEFLTRANLTESSLMQGEPTGLRYYEHKVSWDEEGYWKVTFSFHAGLLVRIQSEINPCYYDYGD